MNGNDREPDDSLPELSANHVGSSEDVSPKSPAKDRQQIGPYRILQKIAEGGMGAVYMAQQSEPIKRRVALKLIKAGRDTEQIIARFDAERQALAMMDHANIARIFDAGTTNDGSPYFVMELVNGIPLTDYCDNNKLSIRERLELFVPVCKAVQHAHTKGIIHRDLKPSNVLVALYDGAPVPKVIDFGLAKATEHQLALTDRTMFTEFGQIVGTLQYMSPEQAEMNQLDVDTRTDVYSLGVMLYELLTGSTPLDEATMREQALLKVLELIREKEPPTPSSRLSQSGDAITGVSDQRKILPVKLQQILRGELDWVVMKSLEKDRTRRYETANAFADDVSRFLEDEPVLARPQSSGYRLQKFFRKNRALVISGLVVASLLLASACISYWFMLEARAQRNVAQHNEKEADQQRDKAEQQTKLAVQKSREADEKSRLAIAERNRADSEREVAEEVRGFLQDSLIRNISVWERANMVGDGTIAGDNITVRELLDVAATKYSPENIEKAFPGRPRVQSEILHTIGNAYRSIDQDDKSVKFARASVEISREHFGDTSAEFVERQGNLFFASVAAGEFAGALKASESGFAGIIRLYQRVKDADTIQEREQRLKEANAVMDQFIVSWFEQLDPTRFAFPVIDSNEIDFATKALLAPAAVSSRNLAKIVQELNGPEHARTKHANMFQGFFDYVIGFGLNQRPLIDKSINQLRDAVEWSQQWPRDRRLVRAMIQTALAVMMDTHGVEPDEALLLHEAGYSELKQTLRKDHPGSVIFGIQVAMAYKRRQLHRKSFDLMTEVLPNYLLQLGAHPPVVEAFASASKELNEEDSMMRTLREAHRLCRNIYGLSYRSYSILRLQSVAALELGDRKKAIAIYRQAFAEAKEKVGHDAEVTLMSSVDLALNLYRRGDFEAAVAQLRANNIDSDGDLLPVNDNAVRLTNGILANAHFRIGNFKSAIVYFRKVLDDRDSGDSQLLTAKMRLVDCFVLESDFESAIPEARELVRLSGGGLFGTDSPDRPKYQQLLAKVYFRSGDNRKTLEVLLPLLKSETAKFKSDEKNRSFLASLHLDAGYCYRQNGQTEEAIKHLKTSVSLLGDGEKPDPVGLALARSQLGGLMLDQDDDDYDKIASLLEPAWELLGSRTNEPPYVQWRKDAQLSAAELIRLYSATGETEKREQVHRKIKEILSSREASQ